MAFTGRIEEIWAEFNGEHLTIWRHGDAAPAKVEIPEGASWELHVSTTADWPEAAPWATAVTFFGDFTAGDANRHLGREGNREFAFNMPERMPAHDVNIGRVRFWKNREWTDTEPPVEDR